MKLNSISEIKFSSRYMTVETWMGVNFYFVVNEVKMLCDLFDLPAKFKFNGAEINVTKHSDADSLWQEYMSTL